MGVRVAKNGVKSCWATFKTYSLRDPTMGSCPATPKQVFCSIGSVEEVDLEEAKERARPMISVGKVGIDQWKV